MRPSQRTLLTAATVALAGAALWAMQPRSAPAAERQKPRYLTQEVDLGPLERTASASGTLSPVEQVQVGTQVSGVIRALHADFNSRVEAGQLLAELDTAALQADLRSAEAALRSAQASLDLATARHARSEALLAKGYLSRADFEESLQARKSAAAAVDQQAWALQRSRTNLGYARIRSPVGGVVLSREVAVGQTVAASFATPVLFKIARDLSQMQIEANVSEADIGAIAEGQEVTFSVDAFPDRVFAGKVHQVRNNYSLQQNVVTYTVVVRAANSDGALRPGMTGYVAVLVGRREKAVRIPNAALRYEPPRGPGEQAAERLRGPERTIYKLGARGVVEPVRVRLGLTDNQHAELLSGALQPGDALVIGEPPAGGQFGPKIF